MITISGSAVIQIGSTLYENAVKDGSANGVITYTSATEIGLSGGEVIVEDRSEDDASWGVDRVTYSTSESNYVFFIDGGEFKGAGASGTVQRTAVGEYTLANTDFEVVGGNSINSAIVLSSTKDITITTGCAIIACAKNLTLNGLTGDPNVKLEVDNSGCSVVSGDITLTKGEMHIQNDCTLLGALSIGANGRIVLGVPVGSGSEVNINLTINNGANMFTIAQYGVIFSTCPASKIVVGDNAGSDGNNPKIFYDFTGMTAEDPQANKTYVWDATLNNSDGAWKQTE